MKQVNYILINETSSKIPVSDACHSDVPNIGYCIVVDASSKFKVPGSKERATLIGKLVRIRHEWPEVPILGQSELDTSATYAPIRVSDVMNRLRLELSELE